MAREIGLRIKLNGLNTVVKDIGTLENELRKAKEDLKELEIGSDLFKELSQEIQIVETRLTELNQATKQIDTTKFAEGFSKLVGGITSGFAAATAAINLFSDDTEGVTEAAADAQNLLTIALSLRGLAEIRTGAAIVTKTIIDKASTAATVATTTATRILYTTLAANPYGAIIAAVGLLVTAYFALKKETKETQEEQKSLNELLGESNTSIQGQILQIRNLQSVLNNTNSTYEQQIGAYQELQKLVPELSNLTLAQARAQGVLNTAIQEEITLINLRAEQKALEDFLVQLKKEQIQKEIIQRQSEDLRRSVENYNKAIQQGFVGTFEKYQKQQEGISNTSKETKKLSVEEERLLRVTEQITAITGKRKINTEDLSKSQSRLNKFVTDTISRFKELGKILTFNYGDPKILTDLKEIDKELKRLAEGPDSFEEKLKKTFKTGPVDIFGPAYEQYRKELSKAVLEGGDELGKTIGRITTEAAQKVQTGDINLEAFVALQALTKEYSNLQKIITEIPDITDALKDDEYYNALRGQLVQTGQIIFEEVDGNIKLLDLTSKEYLDNLTQGTINFEKVEEKVRQQIIKSLTETGKFTEEQTKQIADERITQLRQLQTGITLQEESIRQVLFETQKLSKDINGNLQNNTETFKNFVLENLDLLSDSYKTIGIQNKQFFDDIKLNNKQQSELEKELIKRRLFEYKGFFEKRKIDAQDLIQLDLLLAQQGIDLEKFSADERIKIIEAFYTKIKGFRETNTAEEIDATDELLGNIIEGLEIFEQTIGRISSLIAQSFDLQLRKLDSDYKRTLDDVVGETEQSNQKRLELEKQYQTERAEIEKRATIKSLEFQLAQGIANGAQAILEALPNPILAAIAAGIALTQVGLIRQQIQVARGLAGGGFVAQGPSHERGGVMLNGGTVIEGGEVVLNRNTSMNYLPLLSSLNQQGGGQPLITNASNSLMEERLLQAIVKTRQEPIRAYVLGSEITSSQAINKRLEELSTL